MVNEQKAGIFKRFDRMEDGLGVSQKNWTDEERVILACRILADNGHADGLAGQISVRSEEKPGCFVTVRLGVGFDEVTLDDICYFNDDLQVVGGDQKINPALRFHLWLYRAREDVKSIVHTHPPYTSALSMVGRPLISSHMDTAMFYDDCAYLSQWPGVPVADEEGRIISETIGDKKNILLSHHGFISTGISVEEATYLAVYLERAAKLQIMAESIGEIKLLRPELALEAREFLLKPAIVNATFETWSRKVMT